MVVTGSRMPKSLVDSSVSVVVMEGEQLRKVSSTTVAQALNFMPGVVVKRSVKDGYNIYMQGFDGDRVLVLADGQPLISPSGAAVDLDQISVADIKRIEVVRGAGSVLYGSSAMGGVVNIITTRGERSQLSLRSELASYDDRSAGDDFAQQYSLQGQLRHKQLFGSAQLQGITDPGLDYDSETIAEDSAKLEKQFARLAIGREFQSATVEYRAQYFSEEKTKNQFRIPGQDGLVYYLSDVEQWQHDIRLSSETTQKNPWQMNARRIDHDETSGSSNGLRAAEISFSELDSQKTWQGKNHELVAGMVLHRDSLDQLKLTEIPAQNTAELDNAQRSSVEKFAQLSWFSPANEVQVGARVQRDSDFGWHHAFRSSGLKTFKLSDRQQLQWRAGIGESYRVPTLKERFYFFDHSNLGYMVLGNEKLKPEAALSFNSTLTWDASFKEYSQSFRAEINGHYSDARDFIDTRYDSDSSGLSDIEIYRYHNIGQAELQGLDVSARYQISDWQIQFNYSYLDARDGDGQRLEDRPYHQIKANVAYQFPRWNLNGLLYVVHERDEQVSDGYLGVEQNQWSSWNVNLHQQIGRRFSWRTGIDNFFNQHKNPLAEGERLFDIRPVASRKIFVSIRFEFM